MNRPDKVPWIPLAVLFVVATNRYANPADDYWFLHEGMCDTLSYLAMANAAPHLPGAGLPFHHAQRIAIPYLLGLLHQVAPVWIHLLFLGATSLLAAGIVIIVDRILRSLSLAPQQATVVLAMVVLNPWAIRPYIAFPEMINDLAFVFGLATLLFGLVDGRSRWVLIGQMIASLSRQTGLLLVPMVLIWLWMDRDRWSRVPVARRAMLGLAVAVIAVVAYVGTARVASAFALPSENIVHLIGGYHWLRDAFTLRGLVRYLAMVVESPGIALALVLLFVHRLRWRASPALILLFGSASIWLQPVLAGPVVTGGNAQRLMTLGILPACVAAGIAFRDSGAFAGPESRPNVVAILVALAFSSLHQAVVNQRIPIAGQHTANMALYGLAALAVIAIGYRERVHLERGR